MPCGRHPCLPRLPGASPRHDWSTKPRDPPLVPASWSPAGGLSHRGPFGAQVGGRHTVLTKPSSPPRERNSDVVGFPFWTSDIGAPFSLMTSFWPDMSCCLAGIPGSLPDSSPGRGLGGAHQHPSFVTWGGLRVLTSHALLPIQACLSVGLEGDPGVRVP